MRAPLFRYFLFLLCMGALLPTAYAQKEAPDSTLDEKMIKRTKPDDIYFDAIKAKNQNDLTQAKELFEQFVALRPEVSAGYYELSKLYYNEKKTDKAEDDIKKAIALDNSNKWYKEQYASILAEKGDYLQAAGVVAELVKSEPDDEEYPKMAADYYERAQKFDEAVNYLALALQRNGDDEDIIMHEVQLYLELNKVDKAADIVKGLIAKDPGNGKYYKLLGDIYDNNKMPEKAAEVYKTAQKVIPDDASVELGLAEHYLKSGDTADYVANVKKVIFNDGLDAPTQLDLMGAYLQTLPSDSMIKIEGLPLIRQLAILHPADAQVIALFGDFLDENNKLDSASWAYKISLGLKPSDFNVWKKLFGNYADAKGADSLIKYTETAMRLFPNLALTSYFNAIGRLNKKDYPGAIKAINRAIDMQPESEKTTLAEMYSLLAEIYHSSKQNTLSDNAYEKSISFDPANAGTLNNYSYYLAERGEKLDEAERMSRQSLQMQPTEATYLDTYGWVQYKKGNYEVARINIQKAISLSGPNADATLYDHLGNVYYKLKDVSKAVEYWKKAKDKGSDDPHIDKKISEGKLYE